MWFNISLFLSGKLNDPEQQRIMGADTNFNGIQIFLASHCQFFVFIFLFAIYSHFVLVILKKNIITNKKSGVKSFRVSHYI